MPAKAPRVVLLLALCALPVLGCEATKKLTDATPEVGQSTVRWMNEDWTVRQPGDGRSNPGNNYWSSLKENVWVDEAGDLHLRITRRNGNYYCAEIVSPDVVGYGIYTFTVSSRIDRLDRNIVLGLFSWQNDNCDQANSEVDIECSQWGDPNLADRLQFSVQPTNGVQEAERFRRFPIQLNGSYSLHRFTWLPSVVAWASYHGHDNPPLASNLIASWGFGLGNPAKQKADCASGSVVIPAPGADTRIHLNLWLVQDSELAGGSSEAVIHRADYSPAPTTCGAVVPANVLWFDSGCDVTTSEHVVITAVGQWTAAAGGLAPIPYFGPDGYTGDRHPYDVTKCPLPSNNNYALVGRIGTSGSPFLVGSRCEVTAAAGGRLYLCMNDQAGYFGDNAGEMEVLVSR